MKLVVGLGNPGKEYEKTRHNIGFMYLDYLFDNSSFSLNKKFNALEFEKVISGKKVLFIKPLSYMNLSGEVVKKYVDYYKINLEDILIVQDDLDMPLGRYKLQYNHGDGGHNGIKNIVLNLGSKKFLRLKIGISKIDNMSTREYVLGKLGINERKIIKNVYQELEDFMVDYVDMNMDLLIGKYNSKI